MEFKSLLCPHCGKIITNIDKCEEGWYWPSDGGRDTYHICPHCDEPIEELKA